MVSASPGRPSKYYFLVNRLIDNHIYCPASIAKLLTKSDLNQHHIEQPLKPARFRVRQSLARVARLSKTPHCGLDYSLSRSRRCAYPGYRGYIWKQIFQKHSQNLMRRRIKRKEPKNTFRVLL